MLNDSKELIIHCCDINKANRASFGDAGAEFYLTIDRHNRRRLQKLLGLSRYRSGQLALLNKISETFGGTDGCFEEILSFLKTNGIPYKYGRW